MDEGIELRHLRYFMAVAEELHFGRAAKRLHIAQPPLSQQIRRLEEMVGHPLLLRTSRAVKLTEPGAALLERAKRTLHRMSEDLAFTRRVGLGQTGSLRVGFIGSGMQTQLPAVLGEYRRRYPDVELRLQETHTSQLIESIRDGSVDVGFLRDGGPIDDLTVTPLVEERFIAIVPRRHRLARASAVRVIQLKDEPFVFFQIRWTHGLEPHHGPVRRAGVSRQNRARSSALGDRGKPGWGRAGTDHRSSLYSHVAGPTVACRPLVSHGRTSVELAHRSDDNNPVITAFSMLARTLFRKGL